MRSVEICGNSVGSEWLYQLRLVPAQQRSENLPEWEVREP